MISDNSAKGFRSKIFLGHIKNLRKYESHIVTLFETVKSEACSEPNQTSKMELYPKIINSSQPLTIFAKSSGLGIWLGSKCLSDNSVKKSGVGFFSYKYVMGGKKEMLVDALTIWLYTFPHSSYCVTSSSFLFLTLLSYFQNHNNAAFRQIYF